MRTLSGRGVPGQTVQVYEASRYGPFGNSPGVNLPLFPSIGQPAPANPVATTTVDGTGAWSVTGLATETLIVVYVDGGGNVLTYQVSSYTAPPPTPSYKPIPGELGEQKE